MAALKYHNQESKRLTYRKLTEKDVATWVEFFIDNNRLHYLGIDVHKSKEALAEEWVNTQLNRYREEGLGLLA